MGQWSKTKIPADPSMFRPPRAHADIIRHPEKWPEHPVLTLVNRGILTDCGPAYGYLFDAGDGVARILRGSVVPTREAGIPESLLKKCEIANPEQLVEQGWRVVFKKNEETNEI